MARHYTVEEARAALGMIGPIVEDMMRLKRSFDEASDPHRQPDRSVVIGVRHELAERLRFLEALSIEVKNLDEGIIDFPTVLNGEEVLLCWRVGEEDISFWHTYEDGFLGRRPL